MRLNSTFLLHRVHNFSTRVIIHSIKYGKTVDISVRLERRKKEKLICDCKTSCDVP